MWAGNVYSLEGGGEVKEGKGGWLLGKLVDSVFSDGAVYEGR